MTRQICYQILVDLSTFLVNRWLSIRFNLLPAVAIDLLCLVIRESVHCMLTIFKVGLLLRIKPINNPGAGIPGVVTPPYLIARLLGNVSLIEAKPRPAVTRCYQENVQLVFGSVVSGSVGTDR